LKGKTVITEAVSLNPIDPELLKVDVAPLVPKLRKNRTAHTDCIRHTREEAATLREIVESERLLSLLNTSLDYACMYTRRIQELLIILQQTCPCLTDLGTKLVAVTPKQIRLTEQITKSRKTTVTTPPLANIDSNTPVLSSTGVTLVSSASRLMSQDNTKKNRIRQTQRKAKKNKLEDHLRTVKSSLNKKSVVDSKATSSLINSMSNMNSDLKCASCNGCLFSDNHDACVVAYINSVNASIKSKSAKTPVVQIVIWYLDSGCTKHMTGDRSQLVNFVQKFLGTVKFGNDHVAKIMGYGVDLLTGFRGNNLYTLSLQDMMASSPICLLSKASKTKSRLWHRRLSHLNFGAINHLARQGLVRGLLKLKFKKDHLCSACAMGKSTKKTHKPKSEDTNQEKLYLLHMDLCGPMLVESANGKKYIIIIVDDYSRFTWVNFLRSKDETLDFIIKFLKMIQFADSTGSPSSTTVDQDAPSPSKSHTTTEIQSWVIPQDVGDDNLDMEVARMGNDLLFGVPIPKVTSVQSSSTASPRSIMQTNHPIPHHNNKWTKDHPLNNIICQLSRPVSTRLQLHEQALFCYYDAFLTFVEPKTYKEALTQS
nr:hypothetical protein [Tanacetum cinerariifolium]